MNKKRYSLDIRIEVFAIEVDDNYYSFKYNWHKNGQTTPRKGFYDSDYDNGMSASEWKEELQRGEALRIALQQVAEEY